MLNEQRSLDVVCAAAAGTAIGTTNLAASSSGSASRCAGRQMLCCLLLMILSGAAVAEPAPVRVATVAAGLNHPWSLAFLPGGDLLVTERNGGLRIVHDGKLESKSIAGIPLAFAEGDGGLLGLTLHPEFVRNGLLYVCLTVGSNTANAASVIRGRLVGRTLTEVTTIFTAAPFKKAADHFGCRLIFSPDRKLLVTLGDGRWYPYQ